MKTTGLVKPDSAENATIPAHFGAHDLAQILGLSRQAVHKRATTEQWPFDGGGRGRGNAQRFFVSALPEDIRRKIYLYYGILREELEGCAPEGMEPARIAECSREWDRAREWQRELALARMEVLKAVGTFREEFKGPQGQAVKRFAKLYGQRAVVGLDPAVYDTVAHVGRSQLYEWEKTFKRDGIAGLLCRHGQALGKTAIPVEQQQFILGTIANNPRWQAKRIAGSLRKRFGSQAVSPWAVRRFLAAKQALDPAVFAFLDSPDKYKSSHQLALGSASEKAEYFLHYCEMDSTPTDVVCDDGKRYTIIGIIDIFSRKCKFLVVKTSNRWGIAGLLRQAIMEWGLPENIVMDHGKDYESKQIREALLGLRINTPWIPPFSPESKPHIERMFRTLAHGVEERLPGYIGHNREERRAIEARQSFADRPCKRGEPVEVGLSRAALQETINRWVEDVYHQRLHTGIGMLPNAKAASTPHRVKRIPDVRALDRLLVPGGVRTIGKKGLRYESGLFWGDDLIPYIGRQVKIRVDMQDAGRVFCFDPQGPAYICEAFDNATSGITIADKIKAKRRADRRVREKAKALKKLAEEAYTDPVAEEMAAAREERAVIRNLAVGDPVDDNPFVDAAMAAAQSTDDASDGPDNAMVEAVFDGDLPLDVLPASWQPSAFAVRARRETNLELDANPKVVRFPKQMIDIPDRDTRQPMYFQDPIEKFHYLQHEQRERALTVAEEDWLQREIKSWGTYAEMFVATFDRGDQRWLARIAPHLFGEYADAEAECDSPEMQEDHR